MNNGRRSTTILVIVAILLLGFATAALLGRNSKSHSHDQTSTQSSQSEMTNQVTIQNFVFSPSNISVKVGTTVTWTNNDDVGHTITADDPSSAAPSSASFGKNKTYSFTFTTAGTFAYHCQPHPYMKGTVVVTQ